MHQRTLLFTDVVDSTKVVERLGDAAAAGLWAEHDRLARKLLAQHGGLEIDRSDGFFLLFEDVDGAAQFAMGYHAAIAPLGIAARIGIHHGAMTLRQNPPEAVARGAKPTEVEGLAKPLAARVMSLARGGQTLLSAEARQALGVAPPEACLLEPHGHYRLKGIEAPVAIFELGDAGCAFTPPADTDKAYRVVRAGDFWQPMREVTHNLAAERDAFVGRGAELRSLARQFDGGARLLTLLGPGGTGKTRIACRYGRAWLGDWLGGVAFCDLSEARSLDGIHFAVALALGVPLGKDDPTLQLGHAIAGRGRCLVILDNFEQVVQHAPATLGRWLDRAGDAAFLVTSRERLRLPGEEVLPLEPLDLETEAIELFVARARAQQPDFVLGPNNQHAVAEVVRLLDGLPLAIELAAARVRVLSPQQIVVHLADRFRLLRGGRGIAARQATLEAAIDWSWQLLLPWEQAALAQCSVFEGGFTLGAAEAVLDRASWPEAGSAIDAIQALVDKSLLRVWAPTGQGRYDLEESYFGMYLSVREYAADKLDRATDDAAAHARQRHGRHFAAFGTDAAIDALSRHGGVRRRHVLALEIDNLVAACRRAIARGDSDAAAATCRAACDVLVMQGPFALAAELGAQVLAMPGLPDAVQRAARVLHAQVSWRTGRIEAAHAELSEVLALARASGDRRSESSALHRLGILNDEQGRMDEAQAQFEQAIAIDQALGNQLGEGRSRGDLGSLHSHQDRNADARLQYEAALAIHREVGDRRNEGLVLGNLGNLHGEQGRMDEAQACCLQAIDIHREVGDHNMHGLVLGNLATVHQEQGRLDAAGNCYERALAVIRGVGNRRFEGLVLSNFASLRHAQGLLAEARGHFESALQIAREVGHRRLEGFVLGGLGNLHRDQGRREEALHCYQAALALHRALGSRHAAGAVLGYLGDLLTRQGRIDAAIEALREGEALLREVANPLELARLLSVLAQAEVAAGRLDVARATLAETRTLANALGVGRDSELGREIAKLCDVLA